MRRFAGRYDDDFYVVGEGWYISHAEPRDAERVDHEEEDASGATRYRVRYIF